MSISQELYMMSKDLDERSDKATCIWVHILGTKLNRIDLEKLTDVLISHYNKRMARKHMDLSRSNSKT